MSRIILLGQVIGMCMRYGLTACLVLIPVSMFGQLNSPYKSSEKQNVRYGAFAGQPKTLDPARAYSSDSYEFIAQIYEPPLQYSYFKRPEQLVGLTTSEDIKITFYNKDNELVDGNDPKSVAYTLYDIKIKPNILFANHPALAKDEAGQRVYKTTADIDWSDIDTLSDFEHMGTRELTAADYVYQIKRLASPKVVSNIAELMKEHIYGLAEYSEVLQQSCAQGECARDTYLNLNQHDITGVKIINDYHFQVKVKGMYRQFKYWLAMPFFAPIPWEADEFYSLPGMRQRNLSFDWYPIGTGPYYLQKNDPNKEMVLAKNPNFRGELFPSNGSALDKKHGYMQHSGKKMPLVDKFIYTLDKESIPRWNKFLQGYYDTSGIGGDVFDQAVQVDSSGHPVLTDEMKARGIRLQTKKLPSIYYLGFNMNDPVVGGGNKKNKYLRQAISIAVNYKEYISLFNNGRGEVAHGPLPPGIVGHNLKNNRFNSVLFSRKENKIVKKSIATANELMVKAGYTDGIDPKTGKNLVLYFDVASVGNDSVYMYKWYRKQLNKIGINLQERATDFNTYLSKLKSGRVQIFSSGWNADYPDPENFLLLLYSKNGAVKYAGENSSNYNNKEVDKLYLEIKNMPPGKLRKQKINQVVGLLQEDAPWVWGFYPVSYTLSHGWNSPVKQSGVNNNMRKYNYVDTKLRSEKLHAWNHPMLWPLALSLLIALILLILGVVVYVLNDRKPRTKRLD
jgi:oligopeptide transport system substrate-binding protein